MLLISEIVASNLKRIRKKWGFRQKEIADIICVDESVYSRYENGVVMISGDKLYKLSVYFDVPIGVFFQKEGEPTLVREDGGDYHSLIDVIEKISIQLKEQKVRQDVVLEKLNLLTRSLK